MAAARKRPRLRIEDRFPEKQKTEADAASVFLSMLLVTSTGHHYAGLVGNYPVADQGCARREYAIAPGVSP